MAVSKRTRFEVLRRDNYTCRYCRSTDGELTIDHVTPVALGGTDDPSNLVAACKDCNAGKTSTSPDAQTVADVAQDAVRWSAAMAKAAEITDAKARESIDLASWFDDLWGNFLSWADLPHDYANTVIQFHSLGLSRSALEDAVLATAGKPYGLHQRNAWRYFCGVGWNKIRELQRIAEALVATEDA